jgi:hypothetical protein
MFSAQFAAENMVLKVNDLTFTVPDPVISYASFSEGETDFYVFGQIQEQPDLYLTTVYKGGDPAALPTLAEDLNLSSYFVKTVVISDAPRPRGLGGETADIPPGYHVEIFGAQTSLTATDLPEPPSALLLFVGPSLVAGLKSYKRSSQASEHSHIEWAERPSRPICDGARRSA